MKFRRNFPAGKQRGFSLLELLLVIAILSLIVGAVFSQMGDAQRPRIEATASDGIR